MRIDWPHDVKEAVAERRRYVNMAQLQESISSLQISCYCPGRPRMENTMLQEDCLYLMDVETDSASCHGFCWVFR